MSQLTTIAPIFTIEDAGMIYADCIRGHYIGCVVIDLACDNGFLPDGVSLFDEFSAWSENEERFVSMYYSEWESWLTDREDYLDLWDMAENFLNSLCDDSVWFGCTEGGDWGLWENEQEEEEGDEDTDILVLSGSMRSVPWGIVSTEENTENE